jgi:D-psicose/D-tagatose/L-ribulose 3-epimerase
MLWLRLFEWFLVDPGAGGRSPAAISMISRRSFLGALVAAPFYLAAREAAGTVKVGVCSHDAAGAAKYGFDYIEPAGAEIAGMSDEEFRDFSDDILATRIRCRAFNSLIRRPDLKVVGESVSLSALNDYLEPCLARCRQLGGSIVVWGSAGSRNVPEGFSRERARQQIADFLRMAGEVGRRNNMMIAIEPLRHQESNILNTGAEALKMVRAVKHPNVRMIIDYYHLREENEDPRILETARKEIVHLHFANPHGRLWPHDLSEDDHYRAFFHTLKKIDYSGGISVEGKGNFEADGAATSAFFRQALNT